ncbi:hypothetical protein [Streptococcus sp. DD12]|uniref:hypothetical protein n=1 Tax=Streptococcus sp. DD12 TaxID=1777880 RepID=UPI000793EB0B|nr:hypothetical protein [Streptococcus sp. DD12]KXT75379.1 hypothetical protein STRDD12_01500 [Streptococcus sp. DD12]
MYPDGTLVKQYNKGLAITIAILSLIGGFIFLPDSLNIILYYLLNGYFGPLFPVWLNFFILLPILLLAIIGALVYRGAQSPVYKAARVLTLIGGILLGINFLMIMSSPFYYYYLSGFSTILWFVRDFMALVGNAFLIVGAFLYLASLKKFNRVFMNPQNPFIR